MRVRHRVWNLRSWLFWVMLFALALLRVSWQGFSYLPLLDDHIQYHTYANLMGGLQQAISRLGLLAARPLAGVLDLALWSRFWPNLFGAVVVLTVLLTLSAWLYADLFDELFGSNPLLFGLFFLLLPINFEATYWLSAATRIVPGLLLAALAGHCMLSVCRGQWHGILGVPLCCLLAVGFYEQAFVLSACLCLIVALVKGRGLWPCLTAIVLPTAVFALYLAFTSAAGPSALYGVRGALNLPLGDNAAAWIEVFLPQLTHQLIRVYGSIALLSWNAFWHGLPLLSNHPFALCVGLACTALAILTCPNRAEAQHRKVVLPVAALLALAPMAPFFVVDNPWVGLRALGCCLPGLALLGDAILELLPNGLPRHLSAGLLSLLFLTASISELSAYRQTGRDDAQTVSTLAQVLPQVCGADRVGILGLNPSTLLQQNYAWHEHIHGVTESRWALTGALRAACQSLNVPLVTPLREGPIYPDYADLSQYDAFLLAPDQSAPPMIPVTYDGLGGFVDAQGVLVAEVREGILTIWPDPSSPSYPLPRQSGRPESDPKQPQGTVESNGF